MIMYGVGGIALASYVLLSVSLDFPLFAPSSAQESAIRGVGVPIAVIMLPAGVISTVIGLIRLATRRV